MNVPAELQFRLPYAALRSALPRRAGRDAIASAAGLASSPVARLPIAMTSSVPGSVPERVALGEHRNCSAAHAPARSARQFSGWKRDTPDRHREIRLVAIGHGNPKPMCPGRRTQDCSTVDWSALSGLAPPSDAHLETVRRCAARCRVWPEVPAGRRGSGRRERLWQCVCRPRVAVVLRTKSFWRPVHRRAGRHPPTRSSAQQHERGEKGRSERAPVDEARRRRPASPGPFARRRASLRSRPKITWSGPWSSGVELAWHRRARRRSRAAQRARHVRQERRVVLSRF